MRVPSSDFNFTLSPGPSSERIFTPSPSQSSSLFGSRPDARTPSSVPSRSSSPASSNGYSQTPPGSIFGGPPHSSTRTFTPAPLLSSNIFGSSPNTRTSTVPARSSSAHLSDNVGQNPFGSPFGGPNTSGTRIFNPPPLLSSSNVDSDYNVRTPTVVPARSSPPGSSGDNGQTALGSIFGGSSAISTRFFTSPPALSGSVFGSSFTVRTSSPRYPGHRSQTASANILDEPQTSGTRIFDPSPALNSVLSGSRPDVRTSSAAPARSSSSDPSGVECQTRSACLFSGPLDSGMIFSGSGLPASAGPSMDFTMAPRLPDPQPSVLPNLNANRNMPRGAPDLPVQTAVPTGHSSFRPRERGISVEIGSVNGLPANRAIDLIQDTNFSSTLPVDEDMRGSNRTEDDLFSPDPIDDRNLQANLNVVKVQLQELSRVISECPLSQDPGTRLHKIYQEARKLSEYKDQERRIVGFIGETGAGKSSVINSILDQRDLARSSGAGAACTSVPTEFRYVDEKHPRSYTIEAEFMDEIEVNGLLEELLRSIRRALVPTDRSLAAGENWAEFEAIAKRSHITLKEIFNNRSDLTIEYLSRPGAEIEILQELKALALNRLKSGPGRLSSLQYTAVADDLESCKVKLDRLTNSPGDSNTPALWPFIKLIRVFLELPVLKTGLVLADLPGLRDMNHAREISPEESARGTDPHARRMQNMNAEIKKLESNFDSIEHQQQESQGQGIADRAVNSWENKIQNLYYERRALLMNQRNDSTKRDLAREIYNDERNEAKDIKIFCVGNELYGNPPHRLATKYRNLSGVRELRSYCRSVPAEARMISTLVFIKEQAPALLDSIHQWILTGRDSVIPARAHELRSALEQAERSLRLDFTSGRGHLARTQSELHSEFDIQVMHQLRHFSVAPQAIENLLSLLSHRKGYIIHIFNNTLAQIIQETESTRNHTLNGHNNSSLIADLMLEAYNECSRDGGNGSFERRKNIMRDHLTNMQLYRKYTDSVQSSYLAASNEPFATLRDQLHEQIEMIARDLRGVVVPVGEVSEPEKAPELVRKLEAKLGTLNQGLHNTLALLRR
ncbi:hypothetical protein N7448_009690 [Penicillium atrosanguineum]|nr:hypothetical protein N7448_009690 [Penicillium atrosanguineum]